MEGYIRAALGQENVDLLIRNARMVSVLTREILDVDVAIHQGRFVGFGGEYQAQETLDARGAYLAPGFIDGHVHIESSMLAPSSFAAAVLPHGTTTVIAEPHEIVNVLGLKGQSWMLEAGRSSGMRVHVSTPSCVPASVFEAGCTHLKAEDIAEALREKGSLGLAEMMNYPGVLSGDAGVWSVLEAARGHRIDGHAAGLSGQRLQAYASAGIHSDHEAVTPEQAWDRLRAGMWLMVREGSAARNLKDLMPVLKKEPRRVMCVTDDVDVKELLALGHLDRVLKLAVAEGLDPIYALSLVTCNPAEYWGLHDLGAIAPGYRADFVLLEDLQDFTVLDTYVDGKPAQAGTVTPELLGGGVKLGKGWDQVTFPVAEHHPVIGVQATQIETRSLASGSSDGVKLVAIERHLGEETYASAYTSGIGLKRGAIGCTIQHDAHNLMVAGVSDDDIRLCARVIEEMQGGVAVIADGEVRARLPLPIGGLMSPLPPQVVAALQDEIERAAHALGCELPHPIMTLAFLGLSVIPSLKLTPLGLFDVERFELIQ
ncbi:adenine deaminase [Deinococcus cellulosilyticus]|uniref:Adenine deaminase n=1 Tax=Deinococcus cellulosilyticus (strain DSM 18568 / NBRC 106333 / KACC 11606 / 5516J-15) TaxID=1223518 RepID=A0A511N6A0_DEIC1|nr:adenine deaminase [Deinococcus cellulosilyticus]GEM47931.1 adenine deaminase [Deinococcus cellulosilyticus NBRC 106333 = KACC 11606]